LTKKKKKLVISNYKSIRNDKFRSDIFDLIGEDLFLIESLDEIVYESLKTIVPINRYLRNAPKSIEKKCGEVLEHFMIKKIPEVTASNAITGEVITTNEDEFKKSYKQRYLENILLLGQAPRIEYLKLKSQAEAHLKYIHSRVKYYSENDFIINYKKNKKSPRTNYEKMFLDFYFRCVNEEQKIVDFIYGKGIRDKAVFRSISNRFIKSLSLLKSFRIFPYRSAYPFNDSLFDHSFININHRIDEHDYENISSLVDLYKKDKALFYKQYFKRKPKIDIINEIEYYVMALPIHVDRKLIINEIIYLFNEERWIAFYGLALSQIEGLFSEMLQLLPKNEKFRSLPNKVNHLRSFYVLSDLYFDYFEYSVPELRNQFMHGVLDGKEKNHLNCYDLLLDIHFLLRVIKELDSPYVELNRILNDSNAIISTLDEIASIIDRFNRISVKQRKEIKDKFINFLDSKLIENYALSTILFSLDKDINSDVMKLTSHFEENFNSHYNIKKLNYQQLKSIFERGKMLLELKDFLNIHAEDFQSILNYDIFFNNYKKMFPNLVDIDKNRILMIVNDYKVIISKLVLLHKISNDKI
jgi:hypothetical protein